MNMQDNFKPGTCAILVACYNRREKTVSFFHSLLAQEGFDALNPDIYLLDDGSTDGTSEAVAEAFPFIKIVKGTGELYWVGSMILIWEYAMAQKNYDFYLQYNDDVVLHEGSLKRLFDTYTQLNTTGVVLVGAVQSAITNLVTYGGRNLYNMKHAAYYMLTPHAEEPTPCHLGNANVFLVDAATIEKIGIFSSAYIHILADYDYTLTANKAGLKVLLAPGFYGYCEHDHGKNWMSGKHPLKKRIQYLYSTKGLGYAEQLHYMKKHFPSDYVAAVIKFWMKTFFPIIWDKFKKTKD